MPHPQLIPDPHVLRRIILDVDDLTSDLVNGARVTLRVEYTNDRTATLVSTVLEGDVLAELPNEAQRLVEAFLWGDADGGVLAWAQRLDRSMQARRVRAWLKS